MTVTFLVYLHDNLTSILDILQLCLIGIKLRNTALTKCEIFFDWVALDKNIMELETSHA